MLDWYSFAAYLPVKPQNFNIVQFYIKYIAKSKWAYMNFEKFFFRVLFRLFPPTPNNDDKRADLKSHFNLGS